MYNPATNKLRKSRDIKWADWTRLDPKDLSIYMTDEEAANIPIGFPEDDDFHNDKNFFSEKLIELPAVPYKVVNHGRNIIYDNNVAEIANRNLNAPKANVIPPDDEDPVSNNVDEAEGFSAGRNAPDFEAESETFTETP